MNDNIKFGLFILLFGVGLLALILATNNNKPSSSKVDGMSFVVIDGCEYLDNISHSGYHIYTHKGNCTNHIRETK